MAKYWKLYRQIKDFYYSLGKIKCPALNNEEILFNQKGFRHLLRKNNGKRPIPDQIRRFKLIFYIPRIIQFSSLVNYEKKLYNGKDNHFWTLFSVHRGENIKLIIMQIDKGNKYFISIMNTK